MILHREEKFAEKEKQNYFTQSMLSMQKMIDNPLVADSGVSWYIIFKKIGVAIANRGFMVSPIIIFENCPFN